MMFLGNLNFVAIAVIGGLRVSSGQLSIGDVQAFIQYSRQFTQPLTPVASMVERRSSRASPRPSGSSSCSTPTSNHPTTRRRCTTSGPAGGSSSTTCRSPTTRTTR